MNDEIEEILELFAFTDENIMWGDIVELNSKKSHLLLDYITNLQEEKENYKLRNEKAIEYCNKEIGNIIANFDYIDTKDLENVRNILKGSDKE